MTALGTCLMAAKAAGMPCHRRGLQRVPRRGGPARGVRAGPRHGDGRQDAGPSRRRSRWRTRCLRRRGEELALAQRQIAAFDEAVAAGQGVAVVDGRIVENLHVASARRRLRGPGRLRPADDGRVARRDGALMTLLILGLGLWWAGHFFKRRCPTCAGGMGDRGKGWCHRHHRGGRGADGDRLPRESRRRRSGTRRRSWCISTTS